MSLYGALFSGVSGLTAQSSAMGAISDNITNVSTIGYKGTTVNFQTLVTKQASATFYSAGGVQSKPRQQTDVQGLLQASTSQTDIALSGNGFYVVNEANTPGVSDPYLFTRAGSFIQDDQGYLKNSQGYYLQGWPTDASGTVTPANSSLTVTNQNIISTDYLESINLSRVGGTAAATTTVSIGANLPATGADAESGDTHKTDVQFFDSLGSAGNMSVIYTKSSVPNQWDVSIAPPPGTTVATLYDGASTPLVYDSTGLLEFTAIPSATSTLVINSTTYTFTTAATAGTNISTASTQSLTQVVADLVARVEANDPTFAVPDASTSTRIGVKSGVTSAIEFRENGVGNISVNPSLLLSATGAAVTNQTTTFTVQQQDNAYSDFTLLKFPATLPSDNDTIVVNGTTYGFEMSGTDSAVTTGTAVLVGTAQVDNVTLSGVYAAADTVTVDVNGAGLLTYIVTANDMTADGAGGGGAATQAQYYNNITTQVAAAVNADGTLGPLVTASPSGGGTGVITVTSDTRGTAITTTSGGVTAGTGAATTTVATANVAISVASMVTALESTIEATDTVLATTGNRVRALAVGGATTDTLYVQTVDNDTNDIDISGLTTAARPTDGDGTAFGSTTISVSTARGLVFDSDGVPTSINAKSLEILGFASGAEDMSNVSTEGSRITLDFGTAGEANGMTQFGSEFSPNFITQNGSKFGTFAGVTIGQDGLVTALFDNGETRKIFQIPVATFTNPNQLESKSGNVWSASQASGDYTLRVADSGSAGQVVQSALEASTVDIGAEFTNMIVVQRAYSASTKIITTADQMLEELMRTK